jgi:hypothetical protein
MSDRVNPFADLKEPPVFGTKPKPERAIAPEALAQIAEQNNFPSRQATKQPKAERRKPRTHRTGRNVQFNAKVTAETNRKIYKLADDRKVTLGELLELAVDALERKGDAAVNQSGTARSSSVTS